MANEIVTQQQPQQTLQQLMNSGAVMKKLNDVLGSEKKAASFVSSVISVANGNSYLRNCNPMTILGSAMVAATLDLPIVPTLGLAYIVPYKGQCQFQLGYKGLIELAERSGQFKNIIDEVVYDGQLVRKNRFTGEYEFDEDARLRDESGKPTEKVIGYMARMDLINGFSKTIFWTKEEVEAHANKFSQAFRAKKGTPWVSDFDAMARKTVLKALFAKYAPKSVAIQNAIKFDQAVVKPNEGLTEEDLQIDSYDVEYADNEPIQEAVEEEVAPNGDLFNENQK